MKIIKAATSVHTVYTSPVTLTTVNTTPRYNRYSPTPLAFYGTVGSNGGGSLIQRAFRSASIIFGNGYDSDSDSDSDDIQEIISPSEWRAIERIPAVPRRQVSVASSFNSKKRVQPVVPIDGKHDECNICCENIADIVVSPCSHRIGCNQCFEKLEHPRKCPECRAPIEDYISTKPYCKQRVE